MNTREIEHMWKVASNNPRQVVVTHPLGLVLAFLFHSVFPFSVAHATWAHRAHW
jgi:hypothetical protein